MEKPQSAPSPCPLQGLHLPWVEGYLDRGYSLFLEAKAGNRDRAALGCIQSLEPPVPNLVLVTTYRTAVCARCSRPSAETLLETRLVVTAGRDLLWHVTGRGQEAAEHLAVPLRQNYLALMSVVLRL